MLKKTLLCVAAMCASIFAPLGSQPMEKVEAESKAGFPFSVQIEKNQLQNPAREMWFDWDVSNHKGQSVKGAITVTNESFDTITLAVRTSNALTSTTGGVDYNQADHTDLTSFIDKSYAFKENVVGLPETVTLQSRETKTIPFNVLVPENAVGEYVSSIGFYYVSPSEKGNNVKREFGLNTTILLRASEEPIQPAIFSNIKSSLTKQNPQLTVDITNASPMVNSEVKETYKVINKQTGATVFEGTIGPFKMAPSTKITYSVNWSGEIAEGEYLLLIGDNEQFDFKLTKEYIKEVEQTVNDISVVTTGGLPWYVVSFVTLLLLVLILLIVWLLVQRRRKNEEERPTSDVSSEQTDLIRHEDLIEFEENEEKK